MKKLLKKLTLSIFKSDKDMVEDYLASSASLQELERRQRELQRGNAPWQVRAGYYL